VRAAAAGVPLTGWARVRCCDAQVAQTLNIVQSAILPFALIPLIHVAADQGVLGEHASRRLVTGFAVAVAALVCAVNGFVLVDTMRGVLEDMASEDGEPPASRPAIMAGFSLLIALYYTVIGYFAVGAICSRGEADRRGLPLVASRAA
jgi:hypothetical protein